MKLRLLLGGLLVGAGVGLMVGAAVVKVPADGSARDYPVIVSTLLGIAGAAVAVTGWRRSAP